MRWLKMLGATVAGAAVLLVVWLVVGNDVASRREMEVLQAWAESPGSFAAFLARYPFEETNEAARRLEAAADPLGLDLRPRARPWTGPETDSSKKASQERELIGAYIDVELSRTSATVEPPSPEAAAVLDRMAPPLGAVEQALTGGEPRWRMDVVRGFDAPIPNLLGQIRLQRILLASALRESSRRDFAAGQAFLEASWALNVPLRARPELISKLIAMAATRIQAGVLRKVPVSPDAWIERLPKCDPRGEMLDALQAEAWMTHEALLGHGETDSGKGGPPRPSCAARVVLGPLYGIQAARLLENWRQIVLAGRRSSVSDGGEQAGFLVVRERRSFADRLTAMMMPNLVEAWKRANRLTVELELTRKVLEARAASGTSKAWPRNVEGIETSALKDARWIYTVTPEGHASIELSRQLDWGKTVGLVLPTRWTSAD